MNSLYEQLRIRFYINQNFPADDFGVSKIKVMQACMNKLQYFIVRRIGAFAVLEYHHSDTDAFAPIQYIVRSESVRFPEDLTDTASGAAGSIRNRTNLGELSNEYVHQVLRASQFQPHASKLIGRLLDYGRLPRWVKLRRTQPEQMSSRLPLKADIALCSRHVSKVPSEDIREC